MDDVQRKTLHSTLCQFHSFAQKNIPAHLSNLRLLLKLCPRELENLTMRYLLNNTLNGSVQSLIHKLSQAMDLIDKAFKDLGNKQGIIRSETLKDLVRIRNTIHAHRFEILLSTDAHINWYGKKFSHPSKIIDLIDQANLEITRHVEKLIDMPGFYYDLALPRRGQVILEEAEIVALMEALKKSGIT